MTFLRCASLCNCVLLCCSFWVSCILVKVRFFELTPMKAARLKIYFDPTIPTKVPGTLRCNSCAFKVALENT